MVVLSQEPHELTVMQWNVLADCFSDAFPAVEPQYLAWEHRTTGLRQQITQLHPDILCMQEVDHFADFYEPLLKSLNYAVVYQQKPNDHADGLCICWKQDLFHLLAQDLHYFPGGSQFALSVRLQRGDKEFYVINTHLKASKPFEDVRCTQVQSLVEWISGFEALPILFCGDFNALPTGRAYELMYQNPHGLTSMYRDSLQSGEPEFTTLKMRNSFEVKCEDYIWLRGCKCLALLNFPSREAIGERGLPSAEYPSDHISLFGKLSFN